MIGIFALAKASLSSNDPNRTTSASKVGTAGISLKATQGRLYTIDVVNTAATLYYLMVFDKASAPVNGDTPIWRRLLPASGELPLDFGMFGLGCALGIAFAVSTTEGTLTLPASNDVEYAALWK